MKMNTDVIRHYDLLIEEGNDPVHDPKPLRDYMNRWDGDAFIEELRLAPEKTALEIGIGTGRLAVRTAPLCKRLTGIDLSPKTVQTAKINLSNSANISLICADFSEYEFDEKFDVIYSSLCFMHIKEKQSAVLKAAKLLNSNGRLVISIDKNTANYIDMKSRKIRIYPDSLQDMRMYIEKAGLDFDKALETEFAYIIAADKK